MEDEPTPTEESTEPEEELAEIAPSEVTEESTGCSESSEEDDEENTPLPSHPELIALNQ